MTSPTLFLPVFISKKELFARLVGDAICEPMLATALHRKSIKPQWQLLADSFNCLLLAHIIHAQEPVAAVRLAGNFAAGPQHHGGLDALRDLSDRGGAAPTQDPYDLPQRSRDAADLIAFIAANYGLDSLQGLLAGFSEYDDWQTLCPAVFGLSAAELETAWRAAPGSDQTDNSLSDFSAAR